MNLFENVKYLANKQGMTIPEFSEKMGMQRTAMYKWKTSSPSIETIDKIAKYFDVSIEFLINSNHVPEWATDNDMVDIELLLKSNINIGYANKELTDVEKKRAKIILDAIFCDKIWYKNPISV